MLGSMWSEDRLKSLKQKVKRRALPLAFVIGLLASVIAVDPFSGQRQVVNSESTSTADASEFQSSESDSTELVDSDPFAEPESAAASPEMLDSASESTSAVEQAVSMESGEISSIGGIDGVSEVGSAHPFDRAYPRVEGSSDPGQPEKTAKSATRKPASVLSWEDGQSLQNLKFEDQEPIWNGKAQLLPNPMFVEQLTSRRMKAIRGGGWVAIDLARGEIFPVELFKSSSLNYTSRAVIEARLVQVSRDGQSRVLNTVNTDIPVVRGIPGVVAGSYEVPETPACLARYSVVTREEVCSAPRPRSAGGAQIRFRFEPPAASAVIPEGGTADPLSEDGDFQFTTVYVESRPGTWLEIGTFNESFTPIGDPNRDGYPDFYLETLSENSSGGRHDLLMSSPQGDGVVYNTYSARFIGR